MPHTDIKDILAPILSNALLYGMVKKVFVFPTNLHCSQTPSVSFVKFTTFVSPTNLHCSQTGFLVNNRFSSLFPLRIYTALKLDTKVLCLLFCLFPLRIYTALKPVFSSIIGFPVCFPYEFTLLSNR